jgi:endonuclease/exonuclease/phosphatase family metal-dependent hydrolase
MTGIRIATFNLENLDDRRDTPLAGRLAVLRPQLARLDADVLCFQEVNAARERGTSQRSLKALDILLQGTPYEDYQRAVTHGTGVEGPRDVHNLVVLSKLAVKSVAQYHNDLVPVLEVPLAPDVTPDVTGPAMTTVRWDRPLLHTTLGLEDGRSLEIINLHLRAPSGSFIEGQKSGPFSWKTVPGWAEAFYLSSLKRSGQALEVRLLIDRLFEANAEALIMVCGDFNAEDFETPLRIIMASDEDTGNGALAARSLVALERGIPADRAFSVLHHGRPQLLDHMLVSRALAGTFRTIEIHNEALGDETVAYGRIDHPPESFHAPLVASFSID